MEMFHDMFMYESAGLSPDLQVSINDLLADIFAHDMFAQNAINGFSRFFPQGGGASLTLMGSVPGMMYSLSSGVYEGGMKKGKRHGRGTCMFEDGAFFEGEWKDGKIHGEGKFTSVAGDYYEGGWKDNKKHGSGTSETATGASYVGEWRNDKKHGEGTFKRDGNVYKGKWKDDHFH